jgi:hypothetical protein
MFHAYGLLFLIDGDLNSILDSGDDDSYGGALRIHRTSTTTSAAPNCILTTTQAIAIKKGRPASQYESQKQIWEGTVPKTASGEPCQ